MKNLPIIFWRRQFVRNVTFVAGGTAGAQAISMLFAPAITRLYGPEAFGILGAFSAIVAVFVPFVTLTYPAAIVLPRQDGIALQIAQTALLLSLAISSIIFIIFLLAGDSILIALGYEAMAPYALMIPLGILSAAWLVVAKQWMIRKKVFKLTPQVDVAYSLFINLGSFVAGIIHPAATVLVGFRTIGPLVHSAALGAIAHRIMIRSAAATRKKYRLIDLDQAFRLMKKYRAFPLFRAPQNIVNALSEGLPIILLASFFGPESAGFYSLARSVVLLPLTLVGQSVQDVLYPEIAESARSKKAITPQIQKATLLLALIGFLPAMIIVAYGSSLFSLIFGANWTTAGHFAQWLSVWFLLSLMNRPSVATLPILNRQKWLLGFEIIGVTLRAGALFGSFIFIGDEVFAIAAFSAVGVCLNIVLIVATLAAARRYDRAAISIR